MTAAELTAAAPEDTGVASGGDSSPVETELISDLQEAFAFEPEPFSGTQPRQPSKQEEGSDALTRAFGPSTLPPGTHLGDFEIVEELGRGGMGVVYRARQLSLAREVALKVLPHYARHGRSGVERFHAEAQAAARLHHTNIVAIYSQGEHEGHFYYAMELIHGVSLDTVIHSRPDLLSSTAARGGSSSAIQLPEQSAGKAADSNPPAASQNVDASGAAIVHWTREDFRHVAELVAEVADALECAHRHGVVHRDIKPHNILLSTGNHLHLTDFGLARLTGQPHLTADGEVMGTPAYLSPEQVRGDAGAIDFHTDIYSLGITLYELLTRHKPFEGETREQILTGICTTEPVAPRRLDRRIPLDLETICLRAIDKDPARRHDSAALLSDDLRRFATGRPILSRRTSRLEKAAKWIGRHRALAAAIVASTAVLLMTAGLGWVLSNARHEEADRILRGAYERLAFFDYRAPQLVQADIDHAAELGADGRKLALVRALASLGSADAPEAVRQLGVVLGGSAQPDADGSPRTPDTLRALYLLSWAQRETRAPAAARATFQRAEQRAGELSAAGVALPADACFFRGLAVHYDDPASAIDSYRQANALRAAEHQFYPQAVLHLARARNQQLYATRSLDGFDEAGASLRQLIDQKHYGSYPYYLLSITHRLAAEIYEGSGGTRPSLAQANYAQALEWARRGQAMEPANDRPITAEAECLESMGLYAEAIAARTRAIDAAPTDRKRWEGYHFRWRLYYWTGNLQAALQDLEILADFEPTSRTYAHVFPAVILAEQGRMDEALAHARAMPAEAPDSVRAVLWSATCLRLLGRPDEAQALLAERAGTVDFADELLPPQTEEWVRALYACCAQEGPFAVLDALAAEVPTPWKLWGAAHFHAAALRLGQGDRQGALDELFEAYRSFDGEERYTYQARVFLQKMRINPSWPNWFSVSWSDVPEGQADRRAEQPVPETSQPGD